MAKTTDFFKNPTDQLGKKINFNEVLALGLLYLVPKRHLPNSKDKKVFHLPKKPVFHRFYLQIAKMVETTDFQKIKSYT